MDAARGQDGQRAASEAVIRRYRPISFERSRREAEALDPHYASVWLAYIGGLLSRSALDMRTRLLVLAAQYTMTGNRIGLVDTVQAAINEGVDIREVLESILQCVVYGGDAAVVPALHIFTRVMRRNGLLDALEGTGLPADASRRGRSLDEERSRWSDTDRADPRLPELLDRYGWVGISTGLQLRPGHHVNVVSLLDALDQDIAGLWLGMCYEGMDSRRLLDERTRFLCIVGACLAVHETYNAPRHMGVALRFGASPAELLEIVMQSCAVLGHPHLMGVAINDLVEVLDSQGRLGELVASSKLAMVREIVAARRKLRTTVVEWEHRSPHATSIDRD